MNTVTYLAKLAAEKSQPPSRARAWAGTGAGLATGAFSPLTALIPRLAFKDVDMTPQQEAAFNTAAKARPYYNEAFGRAGGPVNVDPGKTVTMNLPKWVQWLGGPTRTSINLQGPAYIPSTDTIGMAGEKGLGTAWHELGHAHQPFYRKTLHPAASGLRQLLGSAPGLLQRWGPALGSLGAAFRGDKDQARNAALLGSGLTLPNLAVEAGASLRGARMMTGGGSPFNRLRTFRGLPTYMALSALPLLAYATRNAVGGFGSPKSS